MNYQTFVVAYDGNWIAVVSAPGYEAARRRVMNVFSELEGDPGDFEVRLVRPGGLLELAGGMP